MIKKFPKGKSSFNISKKRKSFIINLLVIWTKNLMIYKNNSKSTLKTYYKKKEMIKINDK